MTNTPVLKITKAYAQLEPSGRLVVNLWLPEPGKEQYTDQLKEDLEWGKRCLTKILEHEQASIATPNHPLSLPSAGLAYLTQDNRFIAHKRDANAPTHQEFASINAGYPLPGEDPFTTALREAGQELLMITNDGNTLVVPVLRSGVKTLQETTLETAAKLGLENMKRVYTPIEIPTGRDLIKTYSPNGVFKQTVANLSLSWESGVSFAALWIGKLDMPSDRIYPIDAEGQEKDGKFERYNRITMFIDPMEVQQRNNKCIPFGQILKNPEYQADIKNGLVIMNKPHYSRDPPYPGPDSYNGLENIAEVNSPHVFGPDDLLRRILYPDSWMQIELEMEQLKSTGRSWLPEPVRYQR